MGRGKPWTFILSNVVPMNPSTFQRGVTWNDYLSSMTTNRELLRRKLAEFHLADQTPFQNSPVQYVLVFTEDWCQDSISALPPLLAIAAIAPLEIRVMRRSSELSLQQSLTGVEFPPVPMFLFYDAHWQEQGRFVEMPRAFRALLHDPAEAMWLKEMYDEMWWQTEMEELSPIFTNDRK